MKTLLFSFILVLSSLALAWDIREFNIKQPLDHFDPNNKKFFTQHMQVAVPADAKANTPVIFVMSGEGKFDVNTYYPHFDQLKTSFIVAQADHRGYSQSYSEDEDQSVPRYVTVKQALADFHKAILSLRKTFKGPFIVIGYSYAGGLAVQLAADHPEVADVVINSSGVLTWPFTFTGHDRIANKIWQPEMVNALAEKINDHTPRELLDKKWQERELLHWVFWLYTQYSQYSSRWMDIATLFQPNITTQKFFDAVKFRFGSKMPGELASTRSQLKVTLDEAKTGKFAGRYWAYQQCYEMGAFYVSKDKKLFPQTEDEYRDYCEKMFGFRPDFKIVWDIKKVVPGLKIPLVTIVGTEDPWYELGLLPNDPQPKHRKFKYIRVPGWAHLPDQKDLTTLEQMMTAACSYLPRQCK